jgi:glutathione peroxidase
VTRPGYGAGMTAVQDIPLSTIDGQDTSLAAHAGKVLLVVNVASKCGLTPQYTALESLYEAKRDDGFEVLGFPANNFGAQEPGTNEEIAEFCSTTFDVQFPMFAKLSVAGDDQHPLYRELTSSIPRAEGDADTFRERLRGHGITPNEDPDVVWNFEKFLVAKDGTVARRFAPTVTPDDPAILAAIDEELAK